VGRTLLRIGLAALGLGLAFWLVRSMDAAAVWEAARRADPWWLAMSLVLLAARFVLWAVKWSGMMPDGVRMPVSRALRVVLAGAFINTVTPTAKLAGGFYRAADLMAITGWRFSTAYGWAVADQIQNTVGSLLLFGATSVGASIGLADGPMRISLLATGVGALVVSVLALALRPWLGRRVCPNESVSPEEEAGLDGGDPRSDRPAWIRAALRPYLRDRAGTGATWRDMGLSVLSFGCLCASNAMVFKALDVGAPILQVAVFLMVGSFAGNLAGMGGLGVTEATLTALYAQIGIDPVAAVAAALLHRACLYAMVLAAGGTIVFADILARQPAGRRTEARRGLEDESG
jgi:uncharacterized membrane protein YbhN (UPF0104 family)